MSELEKREDGKLKLTESIKITNKNTKKDLSEAKKVINNNGKSYKCISAYEAEIWKLDQFNLNERLYSTRLAEKIINTNVADGQIGLADHPSNDGSVKDIFCVWHNPHISEGYLKADCYLVGKYGTLANEVLDAGGSIEFSSSGFGDLDSQGRVIEENYELERLGDWVLNSSYQVYARPENEIVQNSSVEESIEIKKDNLSVKDNTNIIEILEEKNSMETKLSKLNEKSFRLSINNIYEKALKEENPKERIEAYNEVLNYCADEDYSFISELREKVQTKLTESEKELEDLLNKGKVLDSLKEEKTKIEQESKTIQEEQSKLKEENISLKENIDTLTEKYDVATSMLENMKSYTNTLKEMYDDLSAEKAGMLKAETYVELQAYVEKIDAENEALKEQNINLKQSLIDLKKKSPVIKENVVSENKPIDKKSLYIKEDTNTFTSNNTEVVNYYLDLVENNENVEKIKDKILGCRTLLEAQRTYMSLEDLIDTHTTFRSPINESFNSERDKDFNELTNSKLKINGWI